MGRKSGRPGFYAVRRGHSVGVYKTWGECKSNVDHYSGARFKKFDTPSQAWNFVNSSDPPRHSSSTRTYNYGSSSTYQSRSYGGYSGGGYSSSSGYSWSSSRRYYSTPSVGSSSSYTPASTYSYSAPKRQSSDYSYTAPSKKKCTEQNDRVSVYTDGACSANGRKGAIAGCGVYWGPKHKDNISQRLTGKQTNQRAEITACTLALETARNKGIPKVTLHTDSQYTINCMNSWIPKWKNNGWKTVEQNDVCNKKDLVKLDKLCHAVDVKWEYVPGHSNVKGNEAADKLATKGAKL